MEKPRDRRATATPIFPIPTIPSVFPATGTLRNPHGSHPVQSPARTNRSASDTFLAAERSRANPRAKFDTTTREGPAASISSASTGPPACRGSPTPPGRGQETPPGTSSLPLGGPPPGTASPGRPTAPRAGAASPRSSAAPRSAPSRGDLPSPEGLHYIPEKIDRRPARGIICLLYTSP